MKILRCIPSFFPDGGSSNLPQNNRLLKNGHTFSTTLINDVMWDIFYFFFCLCFFRYSQCVGQKLTQRGAEWEHCHNKPNHLACACVAVYVPHPRWRQLARRHHVQPERVLRTQLCNQVTRHTSTRIVAVGGLVAPSRGKVTHRTNFHINCTVYILHFAN